MLKINAQAMCFRLHRLASEAEQDADDAYAEAQYYRTLPKVDLGRYAKYMAMTDAAVQCARVFETEARMYAQQRNQQLRDSGFGT